MMGSSLQSLMLRRLGSTSILKPITPLLHENLQLRVVMDPAETYLFDELDTTSINEFV